MGSASSGEAVLVACGRGVCVDKSSPAVDDGGRRGRVGRVMEGPAASVALANKSGDVTHFNQAGGRAMADLVLQRLSSAEPTLGRLLQSP